MLEISPRQIERLTTEYRNPQERLEDQVRKYLTTFPEQAEAEMLERGMNRSARKELRCYWEMQKLAGGIEALRVLTSKIENRLPDHGTRAGLDHALKSVLVDLLAKGSFMALNQILSAGIISAEVCASPEIQKMAQFVCVDQIACGRTDFIKEVSDRLVPNFGTTRGYKEALAQGIKLLIDEKRYDELPYFVEIYPHAGAALAKLAAQPETSASLAQALPYALPENMRALNPIRKMIEGAVFQEQLEDFVRGCAARGDIRSLILAAANFPLSAALKDRVQHTVAHTVAGTVEAALYYYTAEGWELVDNFHKYVEYKALALRAAALYDLPPAITAGLRRSHKAARPALPEYQAAGTQSRAA